MARTVPLSLMAGAHARLLDAKFVGRRNVQGTPESLTAASASRWDCDSGLSPHSAARDVIRTTRSTPASAAAAARCPVVPGRMRECTPDTPFMAETSVSGYSRSP